MDADVNMLIAREVAARHRIDVRTLLRAMSGAEIHGHATAERARDAIQDYNERVKKEETER